MPSLVNRECVAARLDFRVDTAKEVSLNIIFRLILLHTSTVHTKTMPTQQTQESDSFRYPNGSFAPNFDNLGEGLVEWRLFGLVEDGRVVVFNLFVAEFANHFQELDILFRVSHQLANLVVVVVRDDRLYGGRAGHGHFGTQQRGTWKIKKKTLWRWS